MYSIEEIEEMIKEAKAERTKGRVAMANYYLYLANTMIEFRKMISLNAIESAVDEIGHYFKEKA